MSKVLKFLRDWIWQLPQNLVGISYKYLIKDSIITRINKDNKEYKCYLKRTRGSISLGKYIFIQQRYKHSGFVIKHEYGHTKQSLILGPLYLIIIGIPSITWAGLIHKLPWFKDKDYYWFYTERWANRLVNL